jgi:uncharacterized protein
MPATDRPPSALSLQRPAGATLLLFAVCLTIGAVKWPALASYVWQRHHVYLAVPAAMPDVHLPPDFDATLAATDAQLVDLGNRVLFGQAPAAIRLLAAPVKPLPPATTIAAAMSPTTVAAPADDNNVAPSAATVATVAAVAAGAAPATDSAAPEQTVAAMPDTLPPMPTSAVPPTSTANAVNTANAPGITGSVAEPASTAHAGNIVAMQASTASHPAPPASITPAASGLPTHTATAHAGNGSTPAAATVSAVPNATSPTTATAPAGTAAPAIVGERIGLHPDDKILFCGDSLMQGLAPMMAPRLKRYKIAFKDLSKQSTGLAYPHYFDWPKTIRDEIAAKDVTVLVMMLGANDAWDIINQGKSVPFNSPGWHDLYRQRVESIAQMADEARLRVIWVGLPPMDNKRLTSGAPVLNEVFREVTSRHPNTLYIPAAEVLTEDGVTFTRYKTNNAGLVQLLRANDGIHLAPAGNRLLSELIWSHVEFL